MSVLLCRAVERFVKERRQVGEIRPSSAEAYHYRLDFFMVCVGRDRLVNELTKADVRQWWARCASAPRTARSRLSTIRSFFDWCIDRGWMKTNPAAGIKVPKVPHALPVVLDHPQIQRVIDHCPHPRERVVVIMMLQLGLRAGEVARLQTTDVDLAGMLIRVEGKGGHEAMLPITQELALVLVPWLRQTPQGPVICRLQGSKWKPLAPVTIGNIVREAMVAAGVKQRPRDGISAHALRRTAITDVARSGAPLPALQGFSRHLSVGSLKPYMRATAATALLEFIDGRQYSIVE